MVVVVIILLVTVLVYACCFAASRADNKSEEWAKCERWKDGVK